MQRLNSVDPSAAESRQTELLDQVKSAFGSVPNATKVMANSPPVLEAFLKFNDAMKGVEIGPKLLTQVKLATSEANACEYCASLLTAVAPSVNERRKPSRLGIENRKLANEVLKAGLVAS